MITAMLSFDDSNAYRWTARKTADGKSYRVAVEKDAPYRSRAHVVPATMTEKEIRAFIEAAVAIPERVAPSKRPTRAAASKPPSTPPGPSLPDKPSPKDGAGWLILIVIGLLALSKKGRR